MLASQEWPHGYTSNRPVATVECAQAAIKSIVTVGAEFTQAPPRRWLAPLPGAKPRRSGAGAGCRAGWLDARLALDCAGCVARVDGGGGVCTGMLHSCSQPLQTTLLAAMAIRAVALLDASHTHHAVATQWIFARAGSAKSWSVCHSGSRHTAVRRTARASKKLGGAQAAKPLIT